MGFFNKMFGRNGETDDSAAEVSGADFVTALQMHLRGELDPALAAYESFAEDSPHDNLAPFFASALKAAKGNLAEATEDLRSLSRRVSSDGATISRAVAQDLVALLEEEPLIKEPDVAEIVISFGDRLKAQGLLQESAVCFEIAAGILPDHASVLHKLGDTLHDLRIYEYAEAVLQEALRHAPNHWDSLYTYAVLLQDLGRFDEAITHYEKAVRLNPDHVKCRNNYGAALMMAGRLEDALAQCTVAAELDPGFPLAKINLGNINLLMGNHQEARRCFREATSLDGSLALAHFGLGSAELSGGDTQRARESFLKAIELNPEFPDFHHAMGKLLARDGNPEAFSYFAAAVELNGSLRDLRKDFGLACLQMGRREEGLEHLRIALEQNPEDAEVRGILSSADDEGRDQ
ncbi:tetratricopeptide repeat protein [Geobacter sp. DSM 9736]|uniref:tetratricopeptide repeat protein n=1 Tax=Geobacter sp. DSM 9736 TaxID=1277350 RepID=UPI000B50CCAD|nr:tetratricopeptide repeat protein [Geobacter sp. DSM 9736]SNB44623.1 Tetratricopeptide repeat-containing protein [Geobacter sp. DSM 9736]